MNGNAAPALYLAGLGMITPLGANARMTAAMVKVGLSAYQSSDYATQPGDQPITMARVPRAVFDARQTQIDPGRYQSAQYDRIVIMAILALREALAGHSIQKPVPLILAMPEEHAQAPYPPNDLLIRNLVAQQDLPLNPHMVRYVDSGRAAGIEGLALAQHLLAQQKADFVLIGGADSYWDASRVAALDSQARVLAPGRQDGFAPGEGAGFLLLTGHADKARVRDGYAVALRQPASGEEPGHLYSDEPYRAEGLDRVFKKVLQDYTGDGIKAIYSSMNGERYWGKEYGVAFLRNSMHFHDPVDVEHPAEGFGDLGAATAPVLIALAAEDLWKRPGPATHLVYSSSDGPMRAAVRVEKIPTSAIR